MGFFSGTKKKDNKSNYDSDAIKVEISAPTDFKRGVHIEVDLNQGTLKGVPAAWKDTFGDSAQYEEDVSQVNPNLLPSISTSSSEEKVQGLVISKPFEFKHNIHVDYNSEVCR